MIPALSFWSPPLHFTVTALHVSCGVFGLGWMVSMFGILRPVVTRVIPDRAAALQKQIQQRIRGIVFWLIPTIAGTGLYDMAYHGLPDWAALTQTGTDDPKRAASTACRSTATSSSVQTNDVPGSWVWWGSLALFCAAAATGALFRFKVAHGGVEALSLDNIRHAHSHLMYMGWATPALMGLIWALLPFEATAPYRRLFQSVVGATIGAALLCYPLFLLYGYTPVQMGPVRMPIAAAASGLNILCWYAFVGLYAVGTWGLVRTGPLRIWDVALAFLAVSTLGAWGVGVLHGFDLYDPIWTTAAIHFYLDLFSEGWFVLGVLGVMVGVLGEGQNRSWKWPLSFIACGAFGAFLLALPSAYLSEGVELVGRLGGGLVGLGLLLFVGRLYRGVRAEDFAWTWGLPLLALGLKAAGQLAGALVPLLWPGDHNALRILYLHLMLLGFVSMGLVAGARVVWRGASVRGLAAFYGAVGLVLGSLVILVWPGGGLAQEIALWAALCPLLVAAGLLVAGGVRARETSGRPAPPR